MLVIPFLNNRQIGTKCRAGFKASDLALNLDNVLSRLVCLQKDVYSVRGEGSDVPPFTCKFRIDSRCDLLAIANEDGGITLYDTNNVSSETVIKTFTAHQNAIFDICWLPDKCQLISGSGDHSARLWDMSQFRLISTFMKHSASVKSVDVCHEQSAIFATGSRDGSINVWDTRDRSSAIHGKPSVNICYAHCRKSPIVNGKKQAQKDAVSSVSAVVFQDSNKLASAGVADGVVKIWDLRKAYVSNPKFHPLPRYQMEYAESKSTGHGCTSLVFDSLHKTLYASSTGHKIFKFNCHTYIKDVAAYEGFMCATYFVKIALSKDDQYLLCGSSDDKAYIWKTSKPGLPILQLPGHAAEVTSVTWSPYDVTKLVTCGDDNTVAIWKTANKEGIQKDVIHAEAKPYSPSSENARPYLCTDQILNIDYSIIRKSPEIVQTPSKPTTSVITSFFSPITSSLSPVQLSKNLSLNNSSQDINGNCKNYPCKVQSKTTDSSSQVLTPCNHMFKYNIINQSPNGAAEKQTSPQQKNDVQNSSTFIENKENSETEISPKTMNQTNCSSQTKRKCASKQSTRGVKRRFHTKKGIKLKGGSGQTIMSYFSVVSSPEN